MNKDNGNGTLGASPASGPRIHRAVGGPSKGTKKLLLVDDNKIVLKTTATKLQAAGYEVLTAEDGGSAIRQARQLKPDLILLDLNFPPDVGHGGGIPWDGFLILSWLRRSDGMAKVPVIVITGGDLDKYKNRWVEAGVRDIFLKPLDHDSLLATIRWTLQEEAAKERASAAPTSNDAATQPSTQAAAEPSTAPGISKGQKVLFVDDTSDWRYLGASWLGENGYEVATAENAIGAMLQASQCKPDLVVLDLNLAGHSAVPLLKALTELNHEVRILTYSGLDLSEAEVADLLAQGAWNCLRKGSLEELLTAVHETSSGPRGSIPYIPAAPAESAHSSAAAAANNRNTPGTEAPAQGAEQHLDSADALTTLGALHMGSTEDLFTAVQNARNAEPPLAPEPIVVPEEMIESAAQSVLIVEDDAAFAETLRSWLEAQSFRVTSVATGAEAVSLITAADVDLILFDLTLPDLHVPKFYETVQALKPHLCPRIVYMTSDDSHASDDGFVRRLKGISLWKPFPIEWLLEAVQTIRGTPQNSLAAR